MPFAFWYRWLLIASIVLTVFGVFVAFFPESFVLAPWNYLLERTFFRGMMPPEAAELRSFLFGPLGGTIAGYFLLQSFIVWKAFRRKEKWAWWASALALMLWFTVDSARSAYHGAYFNVLMINLPTLIVIGAPLAMTYTSFRKPPPEMTAG